MSANSKVEAVVLLQRCGYTHRTFGIRVQKYDDDWYRTWAFPISEKRAKAEGYGQTTINGTLTATEEYPGCPYCGTHRWVLCGCGHLACGKGESTFDCPWCGRHFDQLNTIEGKENFTSDDDL